MTARSGYSTDLTFRERQVLAYVAEGHSNPEIAEMLGLSRNTVKTYLQIGYQKLGARNRVQAVKLAASPPTRPPLARVDPGPGPAGPCAEPCLPEVLAVSRRVAARLSASEPPEVTAMREAWAEVEAARVTALERMPNAGPPAGLVAEQPAEPAPAEPPVRWPPIEGLLAAVARGDDPWAFAHVKWT